MTNKLISSFIYSILIFAAPSAALSSECGTWNEDKNAISSKSGLVQFKVGGTDEFMKEWMGENVDTAKQRNRINECAPGLSSCLQQFPDSNKEGQLLIKISLRDDQSRARATEIDIQSKDFQNEKFISCVKDYWRRVSFPSLKDQSFKTGVIQVSLQARKVGAK